MEIKNNKNAICAWAMFYWANSALTLGGYLVIGLLLLFSLLSVQKKSGNFSEFSGV